MTSSINYYDISRVVARLTVAIVLFPHGAQKLLAWWGGHGFTSTMKFFTETVGLPYAVGVLVILIEFICPLMVLIGAATRHCAFLIAVVMIGVVITVQHEHFFMNWFGTQSGEGMEFFVLMIGLCLSLLLTGPGAYSIDNFRSGFAQKLSAY